MTATDPGRRSFNKDWLFSLSDSTVYASPSYAGDTTWRVVNLPHDRSREGIPSPDLASCTGYLPGGTAWYRKHFTYSPDNERPLTHIYFEGIYNRSDVYLNGHLIGSRPNGYVSTEYDLTPWIREGDNVIAVRVDHSRHADSRWYTGSGIYRDVWLYNKPARHIDNWGVIYTTSTPSPNRANVDVAVVLAGSPAKGLTLSATLSSPDGKIVATKNNIKGVGDTIRFRLPVKNPQLWDTDNPNLYKLTTRLSKDNAVIDTDVTQVGIRSIAFDPDTGFTLNGKSMKLKGVCLHHDAGVLGAAVPPIVIKNRLQKLKEIGTNAIRCSHNPQAPKFYDYCDSLGLLVMDEGSDEWEFPKRKWIKGWNVGTPGYDGTYDFFEEWIETDVTDMVRRDRVHPSIILWSVGNEVDYPNDPYSHPILDGDKAGFTQPIFGGYNADAPNAERIGLIADRLAKRIRQADPSRPVTGALAGVVMSNCTIYPEVIDVVGYNYTESRYATDHEQYPNRVIYGSENRSDYQAWTAVRDNDFISGQFIWTGADYLGESGRWPSRGLGTGLLDFSNHIKPRGYFRRALWSDTPAIYIGTSPLKFGNRRFNHISIDAPTVWNYTAGDSVRVVCYTNMPSASLWLNDLQIGEEKPVDPSTGVIYWDTTYQPGTLTAISNDRDNRPVTYSINTLTRPAHMQARVIDRDSTHAIVEVELLDDNDNLCTLADNMVSCHTQGARLLGLESGSNTDMSQYTDRRRRFYNGTITAYIELQPDRTAHLTFTSPLLPDCTISL